MTTQEDLVSLLNGLKKEQEALRKTISTIAWHMRSYTREEVWTMSREERDDILTQIEDRMELVSKTGLALI